jgi:hypothetical protein
MILQCSGLGSRVTAAPTTPFTMLSRGEGIPAAAQLKRRRQAVLPNRTGSYSNGSFNTLGAILVKLKNRNHSGLFGRRFVSGRDDRTANLR